MDNEEWISKEMKANQGFAVAKLAENYGLQACAEVYSEKRAPSPSNAESCRPLLVE